MKRPWSKDEEKAVMRHFSAHISKGNLASKREVEQCKVAEAHVL